MLQTLRLKVAVSQMQTICVAWGGLLAVRFHTVTPYLNPRPVQLLLKLRHGGGLGPRRAAAHPEQRRLHKHIT